MKIKIVFLTALLFITTPWLQQSVIADTSDNQHARKLKSHDPGVNARQHRQKHRIADGIRSGELTKGEVRDLHGERKDIRQQEQAYKADGHLTIKERRDLQQNLNQASEHIYESKHNHVQR